MVRACRAADRGRRNVISKLPVRCKYGCINGKGADAHGLEAPARKKPKTNAGGGAGGAGDAGEGRGNAGTHCDWIGKLDDLQQHLDSQCGFVVVDCPFKPHGCKHSCSRRDMALHHAHAGTRHAELTAQRLEALAKANSDMESKHSLLAARLEQLVAKVGRVSEKVTGVGRLLKAAASEQPKGRARPRARDLRAPARRHRDSDQEENSEEEEDDDDEEERSPAGAIRAPARRNRDSDNEEDSEEEEEEEDEEDEEDEESDGEDEELSAGEWNQLVRLGASAIPRRLLRRGRVGVEVVDDDEGEDESDESDESGEEEETETASEDAGDSEEVTVSD